MKFVAISDTHTKESRLVIPQADVLLHAGDLTWVGDKNEVEAFCRWAKALIDAGTVKRVVTIAGNHDLSLDPIRRAVQKAPCRRQDVLPLFDAYGITYLEDSSVTIDNVNIYGSPWSNEFCGWAFMDDESSLAEKWKAIPEDTDILIVHGPPFGYGDATWHGNVGSKTLRTRIEQLINGPSPKLKAVVTGHIHEAHGVYEFPTIDVFDGGARSLRVYNASVCNLAYAPINPPLVFEL